LKAEFPPRQQDFLRYAMKVLGMTRDGFSTRLSTSRRSLDNWLQPSESKEYRPMPDMAWRFIREIVERHLEQEGAHQS
jgi:hypothetical protein